MSHSETGTRVAGAWLAIASALLAVALVFHGPPAATIAEQMTIIAAESARWTAVHWTAAAALSLFTVAGLLVLAARSHLTASGWTMSAWAVVAVGALWTVTTAIAEATAVAGAAVSGDEAMFRAWWKFSEGEAGGFVFLALAVALIAGHEARGAQPATPAWAAGIAVVAGIGSFAGWAVGMWFDIPVGNLVWVVSSLVMCLWLLWFGTALARTQGCAPAQTWRGATDVEHAG